MLISVGCARADRAPPRPAARGRDRLPDVFITALAFIRNLELPNDVQARAAVVIACGVLAWTFWRLLDVGQIWVRRGIETEPSILRRLLRAALPATALIVALLALAGYVYSAGLLLQALITSISMVIAISLALGLLARWFLLGERRLARAGSKSSAPRPGTRPPSSRVTGAIPISRWSRSMPRPRDCCRS